MLVSAPDQGQSAPAGRGRSAVIWLPGKASWKASCCSGPQDQVVFFWSDRWRGARLSFPAY